MSTPALLTEILKSAQTASSLLNLSVLCANTSGVLQKTTSAIPNLASPVCEDANTATPGWMKTTTNTLNLPKGISGNGSFILTLQWDSTAATQIFFHWIAAVIYIRKRNSNTGNTSWIDWKKLAIEAA